MNDRENMLLDLFMHEGWKTFICEMQEARDAFIETAHQCRTLEDLYLRKGQIQQLNLLLIYEDMIKAQEETNADAA